MLLCEYANSPYLLSPISVGLDLLLDVPLLKNKEMWYTCSPNTYARSRNTLAKHTSCLYLLFAMHIDRAFSMSIRLDAAIKNGEQ